ncbi:MAG: MraY family glycosyltransferase [Sulfuricurvum sp.]|uniref:glycosyltransferase family 4 protein n=1 Tax=Sulfuricurvum sp. TaxID=2025608 RepID=UPI002627F147|nr:MraY family glycosyltransferase [Sulfuricurvum sp.]MDD5158985.1 MraY family glycosyltransferase [Sulfuricurvum sp.]
MQIILLPSIFIIAIVLHFILIRYAHLLGLVDTPNERSMHKKVVPRAAGIAIFFSVAFAHFFFNWEYVLSHAYIHIAILFVFLVGLVDDRNDISPRFKFVVIFFATIFLYQGGIHIENLGTYFNYHITLPWYFIFPFTFFAIAGFTNALNLIDGLDGLAGTVSLVMLITFFAIGITYNDTLIITLSTSFIIAVIAFLLFNWHPAKIFMGDSGSLTLGFVISILSIQSIQYITPTAVLFIIAIPLLDTFIVMTRRIQRGKSPFKADKNHMHHFLFNMKGDVRFTVILLIAIQLIFSIIGFQLREEDDFLSLVLFGLLFFAFLNLFDQRLRRRKKGRHKLEHMRILSKERNSPLEQISDESTLPSSLTQVETK